MKRKDSIQFLEGIITGGLEIKDLAPGKFEGKLKDSIAKAVADMKCIEQICENCGCKNHEESGCANCRWDEWQE